MAEKLKISKAGKIVAVLSLVFTGTGAGYYFGTGAPDPFRQLAASFQSAAEAEIAEKQEDAFQAAFTKKTCENIDESLDNVFQAAGAPNDFTATLQKRSNGRSDICRIYLRNEEVFAFNHTQHFSTEHYADRQDIEIFMKKSLDGLSYEQLIKLQKTLPALLKDLAP